MIDEAVKEQYRSVQPPEELKGRVLSACKSARKRRDAMRKRLVSVAACFVILIGAAGYGFSPVPQLSSGGAAMENGVLCVAEVSVLVESAAQNGVRTLSGGEILDGCIAFSVDRDSRIKVSAGTLYLMDTLSGMVREMGTSCRAEAGEELYWQCEEKENAALTLRSDLRSVTLRLSYADGRWWLYR